VRAGSSDFNRGGQVRFVRAITVHPQYDPRTSDYDLAILRLKQGFITNAKVRAFVWPQC
jgi:hypothetical protein